MPSVFELFGELRADTGQFEGALRSSEARLKATESAISSTEQRARGLGQTSATVARSYERLNEKIGEQRSKLQQTAAAFARGEATSKQMASALGSVDRAAAGVNSRLRDSSARLTDFSNRASKIPQMLQSAGQGVQNFGRSLTVGLTAPLAALTAISFQQAASFDAMRNRLNAATGSADAGKKKFKELFDLAQGNAGVFTKGAVELYAFLKPLKLSEDVITKTIKSFGKLKLANDEIDINRFGLNLTQLFQQGFEQPDLKEALGNFPRFGEVIQKAFSLSASDRTTIAEEMKQQMAKGLKFEDFFARIVDTIAKDPSLASLNETIGTRMAKSMERIGLALEPLGASIAAALERILPTVISFIERLSGAFTSLSPVMQTVVLAAGAIAAAMGPALIVIGSLTAAIAAIVGSATTIGIVAAVIAGLALAMAPIIAMSALWYKAWQEDFAGIKTFVLQAWADIQTAARNFVAVIAELWSKHGETIKTYARSAWEFIKNYIDGAITAIGGVIKVGLNLIRGDWQGAWNALLDTVTKLTANIVSQGQLLMRGLKDALFNLLPIIAEWGTRVVLQINLWMTKAVAAITLAFVRLPITLLELVPVMVRAGTSIGEAIIRGIRQGLTGGGIGGDIELPGNSWTDLFSKIKILSGRSEGVGGDASSTSSPPLATGIDKVAKSAKNAKEQVKELKITIDSLLDAMRSGTMGQESGGNPNARNGRTGALGLFQVMPGNIAPWTKEVLGRAMGADEFRKNTAAQIAVFNAKMGEYLRKAMVITMGDWQKAIRMAAAAWYGGPDNMKDYAANWGGKGQEPTFNQYTSKVLSRTTGALKLGKAGGVFDLDPIVSDILKDQKEALEKVTEAWTEYVEALKPAKSAQMKIDELVLTTTKGVTKYSDAFLELARSMKMSAEQMYVLLKAGAKIKDSEFLKRDWDESLTDPSATRSTNGLAGGGLGLPTNDNTSPGEETSVPPRLSWAVYWTEAGVKMDQFWTMFRVRMEEFKASLPSIRQALGENLVNVVAGIGDVFANAVMQWDGTAKNFFKSLAQGFSQMARQIIAELVRIMVMKAVMKLIGAFAGAGGGAESAAGVGGGAHSGGGMASGGLVRGPGTSTSDSIFARLSNNEYVVKAKAVAHYGAGFFERLNNLQMPNLAFAGGGLVGGSSMSSIYNNSSSFSPTVNVYMPPASGSGGNGGGATKDQIERAVTAALYKSQLRNK